MTNKLLIVNRKDLCEMSKDKDLSEIEYIDLRQDVFKHVYTHSLVIFNDATDCKILKQRHV